MTPPPAPPLNELIDSVDGPTPLERLSAAAATAQDLESAADALLSHFVEQCRQAGHSWTDISGALGVTKQAVHKRFAATPPTFERFTPRARAIVSGSQNLALGWGHHYVGTEHMLVAMLDDPESVGSKVLVEAGVTRAKAEKRVLAIAPKGDAKEAGGFTARAVTLLQAALGEALQLGHNYIGTEHILLAMLRDPESVGSRVLSDLKVEPDAVKKAVADKIREIIRSKQPN